ncbi:MAG: hypothetical protein SGPRY_005577, partial [Prymnesium sp.]
MPRREQLPVVDDSEFEDFAANGAAPPQTGCARVYALRHRLRGRACSGNPMLCLVAVGATVVTSSFLASYLFPESSVVGAERSAHRSTRQPLGTAEGYEAYADARGASVSSTRAIVRSFAAPPAMEPKLASSRVPGSSAAPPVRPSDSLMPPNSLKLQTGSMDSPPPVEELRPNIPQSAPSHPPGGLQFGWEHHPSKNCWWDGHGATEVDLPAGSAVPAVESLAACKAACMEEPTCEGVLYSPQSKACYRKGEIILSRCSTDVSVSLYVKVAPPHPPSIPAPTAPPLPPLAPPSAVTEAINHRFRLKPYSVRWPETGALPDAAVLIHIFDGWEEHETGVFHHWRADLVRRPQLSASIIYADQRAPDHQWIGIPIFSGFSPDGVVLRPGDSTRILRTPAVEHVGLFALLFRAPGTVTIRGKTDVMAVMALGGRKTLAYSFIGACSGNVRFKLVEGEWITTKSFLMVAIGTVSISFTDIGDTY